MCVLECGQQLPHDEVGGDSDEGEDGDDDEVGAGDGVQGQVVQLLPGGSHQGVGHGAHLLY